MSRDILETLLASDSNVVNVAASMVTMTVIKSGPFSRIKGASTRLMQAKGTSGV